MSTRQRGKKPRFRRLIIAVLIAAVAGTGWIVYERNNAAQTAENGEPKLETAEALEGTVSVTVESPAIAEPYRLRTLRAPAGATVQFVAQSGALLRGGDPLIVFDSQTAERQVALAEIALREAEINRERALDSVAKAEKLLAEREALLSSGAVAREQVDSARDQLAGARFTLQSAELAVDKARLALRTATDDYGATVMRAPFDGTVLSSSVNEGDWVGQNSTLLTYGDLSRLRFTAEVDEYDINRIEVGMPVSIRSDTLEGNPLRATLESISPEAQIIQNISVFRVTATADNSEGRFKPGMSADLVVLLARDSGLVIPARAVSTVRSRSYVDVVLGDEVETRRIEVGATDGASIVVLDGLSEGELVKLPSQAGALPTVPVAAPDSSAQQPSSGSILPMPVPGGGGGGGGGGGR